MVDRTTAYRGALRHLSTPRSQALAAITLLAAVARFATLDLQSFWHDEAVTVNRVLQPSLWDTLTVIPSSESTPPLYYLLAWIWTKLFGVGEVGLRSFSALCGTLTVPVIYAVGARLASVRIALVAAALAAMSPLLVWHSQEARAYALLVLLCALSFLFFVRARDGGSRRDLALWALASAAGLATHYFAVFVVAPEALLLLIVLWPERRRAVIGTVGAVCAAGLALLPLAVYQASNANNDWINDTPLITRLIEVPKAFLIGQPRGHVGWAFLVSAFVVMVAVGLVALRADRRERRAAVIALAVGGAGMFVPLVLALAGADFFYDRNVLVAFVPLIVAVAIGLGAARAGWIGLGAAAAACLVWAALVVAVTRDENLQRADWRGAAKALGPAPPGGRVIVTAFLGDDPLEVYRPGTRRFPRRGARVREVYVIAYSRPSRRPPAPGFHLVEDRPFARFTLLRFESPRPRRLRREQLRAQRIGANRKVLLFEPSR